MAGFIKGGSIGVALFGMAGGMPLIVPAAGIGLIGGAAVGFSVKSSLFGSVVKTYKNKESKKSNEKK